MKSIRMTAALSLLIAGWIAQPARADQRPRPVVTLSPSADNAAAIQAQWLAGNDVLLAPGVYTFKAILRRPAHASLRGVNRQVVVLMPGSAGDLIEGSGLLDAQYRENGADADGGGISDLTFDATDFPGAVLYRENVVEPGISFSNLRIVAGEGPVCNSPGATWNNIEFVHANAESNANNVTITNISFFGQPAKGGTNEFLLGGNNVTLRHGLWRSTQRGVVIRWAMDHALFEDLDFEDVCAGPVNANEVILLESGGPLTRSTFDTVQIHNCRGRPLALDYGGATGNTFTRFDIDGGEGVSIGFAQQMGHDVTGNHFTQFEMRDVVHFAFNASKGNVLDNCAIINPRPSWCNQENFNQNWYARQAVIVGAEGNSVDYPNTVRVIGRPEGWTIGVGGE